MTVNQRLKQFIKHSEINQSDLAAVCRVSRSAVSGWFTKGESISDKVIVRIIVAYKDVNARWLITGEGEMLEGKVDCVSEDPVPYGREIFDRYEKKVEECAALKVKLELIQTEMAGGNRQDSPSSKARAG